jgi:hypothetical protein
VKLGGLSIYDYLKNIGIQKLRHLFVTVSIRSLPRPLWTILAPLLEGNVRSFTVKDE